MALRISIVRLTDPTLCLASRSYRLIVDGDEPPATNRSPTGTKAAAEALARDVRLVEAGEFDVCFVISHDLECDIIAIAASVAYAVVFRVVEQEPVTIRARVVGAGRQ